PGNYRIEQARQGVHRDLCLLGDRAEIALCQKVQPVFSGLQVPGRKPRNEVLDFGKRFRGTTEPKPADSGVAEKNAPEQGKGNIITTFLSEPSRPAQGMLDKAASQNYALGVKLTTRKHGHNHL